MGSFIGHLPRQPLFRHKEASSLASRRERNSIPHAWKSQREDAARSDKVNMMLSQLRTEVARLSQRSQNGLGMYPFKIYNFPASLRRYQVDDAYKRFKVRTGLAIVNGQGNFSDLTYAAPGSDAGSADTTLYGGPYGDVLLGNFQTPPDSSVAVVGDGISSSWNEFVIHKNDTTYIFWYCFILPTTGGVTNTYSHGIAVAESTDPTTAVMLNTGESFDATNVWFGFGQNDLYNYKIGSVFINTTSLPTFPRGPIVNQTQFGNLLLPGSPYGTDSGGSTSSRRRISLNWRGTYDAGIYYYIGDVVTITYADGTGVNSLYQYVYDPDDSSIYAPTNLPGPMTGISPNGNSPDPWKLLSKSPSDADYHNGAYDASKFYLRTA